VASDQCLVAHWLVTSVYRFGEDLAAPFRNISKKKTFRA